MKIQVDDIMMDSENEGDMEVLAFQTTNDGGIGFIVKDTEDLKLETRFRANRFDQKRVKVWFEIDVKGEDGSTKTAVCTKDNCRVNFVEERFIKGGVGKALSVGIGQALNS